MNWEHYASEFEKQAIAKRKSHAFIDTYLSYAKKLFDVDLPIIFDMYQLAAHVGFKPEYVAKMSHAPKKCYRSFFIFKRNGKLRSIDEPLPDLKEVQQWILREILEKISISEYAKGFVRKKSIRENARFHRNQPIVITIDIKDFFPSIYFFQVYNVFKSIGYSNSISTIFANLCCLSNALPQGAPTSPLLSNIIFKPIDDKIASYITSKGWRYTRYADDLTFSGSIDVANLLYYIRKLLNEYGFCVNESKTRVARRNTRQEVTGVITNVKLQAPREYRKYIRQQIYYIRKFGVTSHLRRLNETRENYLYHLLGKISFAYNINKSDAEMKEYMEYVKMLIIQDKSSHKTNKN